jgi:hypothetical protein
MRRFLTLAVACCLLMGEIPASAQEFRTRPDPAKRVIAVRTPAVHNGSAANDRDPPEPEGEVGPGAPYARDYAQVAHPLYRLYFKRHEQQGRWQLEPWEVPERLDAATLIFFSKAARTKQPAKFATLADNPDKTFRFKGEAVKAGALIQLAGVSYVFDPRWKVSDIDVKNTSSAEEGGKPVLKAFSGTVGLQLANRIFDAQTGVSLGEQSEAASVSLILANLPLAAPAGEAEGFERTLDPRAKQELQLGRVVMPDTSPQIQLAIGRQVLPEADALVRRILARTRDLDAFRLRPYVSGVVPAGVQLSHGRNAGVNIDATFWAFKAGASDAKSPPEPIGFVKVREVERALALAQPIAVSRPLASGDSLLYYPQLGLSTHFRAWVTPLSLQVKQPDVYLPAAKRDIGLTPPQRLLPIQTMLSLPLELNLGPIFGAGWLSETQFLLEPAVGLRLPALDLIGLGGFRRKFYFGPLAVTGGVKTGVTYSATTLGTVDQADLDVPNVADPTESTVLRVGSTVTATQLGYSVGPELALDYQFHPNLSAGIFADFIYTLPVTRRQIQARPRASDPDRTVTSVVADDLFPVPEGPLQTMRLGTGAHFTVTF